MMITYAYHFICELMITFFLSIPIFYYYYDMAPYMSFSFMLLASTVIHVQMLQRVTSYVPYMIFTPCFIVIFYLLDYPIFMSILFGTVMTWRAIVLRKEHRLDGEGTYLRWILILSVIIPLLVHDLMFILFVVSVLFLLIIGNIVRNMTVLPKHDRRSKSVGFLGGMFIVVVAGVTVIAYSFHGVRTILGWVWTAISTVLVWIGSSFVYVLSLIPMPEVKEEEEIENAVLGEQQDIPEGTGLEEAFINDILHWAFMIGCIIAAFFLYRFIRKQLRKTFKPMAASEEHVTYEQMELEDERKRTWKDRFKRLIPLPKDHVRKRMYQFEKSMSQMNQGRKPAETIEEWVNRTGWDIHFDLYQRVRYGTYQATNEEVRQLEDMMEHVEKLEQDREKE